MKKLLLLTTLITFVLGVSAQTTIFEDDFEDYTPGTGLVEQSDDWETWSGGSGGSEDAVVSDDYAMSGSNSVLVTDANDVIYPLGQKTSGVYNIKFAYYLEDGYGGYYNFQHTFGSEWAFAVYLNDDGTGYLAAGGEQIDLTYPQDEWFHIENHINLDEDEATLMINGEEIHTWQYSLLESEDNTVDNPMLDVVNFFSAAEDPATPKYYFDDFAYLEGELVFGDGFEPPYTLGEGVADQSDNWTTWSGSTGGDEDAVVSDDFAHNGDQSMLVTGTNDMVYEFGNLTSGKYNVNFWMYMESGYGGYFNLQHAFGSTWAMETYFLDDGTGYLSADGQEIDVTYPQDQWFYVENQVDLDEDLITLTIDGEEVHSWEYSQEPDGTDVPNPALDVVNFYSAAEEPADPKYYIDDFEFWLASTGLLPPSVAVDTEELTVYETGGGVDPEVITIENNGEQDMNFSVYPVYPNVGTKKADNAEGENVKRVKMTRKSVERPVAEDAVSDNPIEFNGERDGTLTHVQSELGAGVGYDGETDVKVGALYRPEDVESYIGMKIDQVIVYHMDPPLNNESTMKIWDRGAFTTPGPGEELYSMDYTAQENTQTSIPVSDDIYLDGKDLWVGYETTDPGEDVFPLGADDGPQVAGVNWSATGPGWSELTLERNWGIIVELVGDGTPTWMSVTPESGTIAGGGSEEIMVDFDTDGLDNGVYEAELHIGANDPENNYTAIPVTLDISTAIIDGEEEKIGVMTYPNPASENINIKANDVITSVKLINQIGQVVYENNGGTESHAINVSNLDKGIYMVQVKTENSNVTTQKVIVE
jgi:hypothetical protein